MILLTPHRPHPDPGLRGRRRGGLLGDLIDAELTEVVRLAYPYAAMYNVNNNFATPQGGWNVIAPEGRHPPRARSTT